MCRRFCETGRFIACFTLRSDGEPPSIFFANAGLTGAKYPLFFAPEVVHSYANCETTLEVSSAA
jgi:hypothetical protein